MSPKRARCPGASPAVVCLLALALGTPAGAADYTLRPEMTAEQRFDDNVYSVDNRAGDHSGPGALPSREISTWVTRLSPAVTLERKTATNEARVRAGVTRNNYASASELDGTDEQLLGSVRQELSPRLSIGAEAYYYLYASASAVEDTVDGNPLVLIDDRPEVALRDLALDLQYALDPSTVLTAEVGWATREYGDTRVTSSLFDSSDRSISLGVTRRLNMMDTVTLSLGRSFNEEISAETLFFPPLLISIPEVKTENALGTLVAIWQRDWSLRWSTQVQAGARRLESEFRLERLPVPPPCTGRPFGAGCLQYPRETDTDYGFVGGVSTSYRYSDRGQVFLSYTHDTQTGGSSTTGSSANDVDSTSVGIAHALTRRLSLSASVGFTRYESTGSGVDDALTDYTNGNLRLEWQMRRNLVGFATFHYFGYDQDRDLRSDRDYVRRLFGVGIRYSFDQEL